MFESLCSTKKYNTVIFKFSHEYKVQESEFEAFIDMFLKKNETNDISETEQKEFSRISECVVNNEFIDMYLDIHKQTYGKILSGQSFISVEFKRNVKKNIERYDNDSDKEEFIMIMKKRVNRVDFMRTLSNSKFIEDRFFGLEKLLRKMRENLDFRLRELGIETPWVNVLREVPMFELNRILDMSPDEGKEESDRLNALSLPERREYLQSLGIKPKKYLADNKMIN